MTKNVLGDGTHRLGWFVDGDPATPYVAVTLEDTGQSIRLTIPTLAVARDDPYARWGTSDVIMFGDDPDRTRRSYEAPEVCQFVDADGSVVLVGCRAWGNVMGNAAGRVTVFADYAVMGGRHLRYSKINGVRSTLPALAPWSGIRSVHTEPTTDAQGRVQRVDVKLESPPNVQLSRRMHLTMRPTWRTSYPDKEGTFEARDVVELMTATQQPRPWADHLGAHMAVRALLAISAWQTFGFSRLDVNRGDDPERVLSGDAIGERWAPVHTHLLPKHTAWSRTPRFLFYFSDIGATGVNRWLHLRDHFERGIQPLLNLVDKRITTLDTAVVTSGILLEAIGYQLALDAGAVSPNSRTGLTYKETLQHVLDDLVYCPVADPEEWKDRANSRYKGVKHADNAMPDDEDKQRTVRENVNLVRYWIAGRLGVPEDVLRDRYRSDPLTRR